MQTEIPHSYRNKPEDNEQLERRGDGDGRESAKDAWGDPDDGHCLGFGIWTVNGKLAVTFMI